MPSHSRFPLPQLLHSNSGAGGMKRGGGKIVEVEGGHIVHSTSRKDRHSKVCTSKGPRDRRVRLSARTAIQFYDVQDRLGYDRPSKAVDWLIQNAKAAIDDLAELPPWRPGASPSCKKPMQPPEPVPAAVFTVAATSSLLAPPIDSDSMLDPIKTFFPVTAAGSLAATAPTSSPAAGFQNYSPVLLSRPTTQSQDLHLSLQSRENPTFSQPNAIQPHNGSTRISFNPASACFSEHEHRMVSWSSATDGCEGYVFNSPQPMVTTAVNLNRMLFGQGQLFPQRGPLQSSHSPLIRPWTDHTDHQQHQPLNHSVSSIGFASEDNNFSTGFRFPVRIQGEVEETSSGFSISHH